jgi:hypothetical protein
VPAVGGMDCERGDDEPVGASGGVCGRLTGVVIVRIGDGGEGGTSGTVKRGEGD